MLFGTAIYIFKIQFLFLKGVTYKQHDSDEEEYDDFGRKKKKFRGKVGEGEPAPSKWGKPPSMTTVTKNNGNNLCFLTKKTVPFGSGSKFQGSQVALKYFNSPQPHTV